MVQRYVFEGVLKFIHGRLITDSSTLDVFIRSYSYTYMEEMILKPKVVRLMLRA